jgi:hypothetical protein
LASQRLTRIDSEKEIGRKIIAERLIIWDKVVTVHKNAIEAVNRTLRQLTKVDTVFGGKVVIFSGDFRQILPVVKFNVYPQSLKATIKSSSVWQDVRCCSLKENMRLASALDRPLKGLT